MPSKASTAALQDIAYHIALVFRFTETLDYEAFETDLRSVYAATRCLEIISEASRRLSDATKSRYPEIAWKDMAGAGNIYRHDYEDVLARQVWDTIQIDLPPLLAVIEQELALIAKADG